MKKLILLSLIITMVSCKKKHDEEPQAMEESYRFNSKTVLGTCDKYFNNMILDDSKLYLVGDFEAVGGVVSKSIIIYDDVLQNFVPYNSNVSGAITSFLPGITDYIGGKFNLNSSSSGSCLASKPSSSSVFSEKATNLKLNGVSGKVEVIKKIGNEIYFGGIFKTLNGSNDFVPVLKLVGDSAYSFGGNDELPSDVSNILLTDIEKIGNTFYFSRRFTSYPVWENSNGGDWKEVAPNTFDFGSIGVSNLEVVNYVLYASTGMSVVSLVADHINSSSKWERVGATALPNLIDDIKYYNGVLYACGVNFLYALDPATNEWKSLVAPNVNIGTLIKMTFIKDKCYALEQDANYNYQLVRFDVN